MVSYSLSYYEINTLPFFEAATTVPTVKEIDASPPPIPTEKLIDANN